MKIVTTIDIDELVAVLQRSGVVLLRTDTLYGIVARADDEEAVKKVYAAKGRDEAKSPIVLIADRSMIYDDISDDAATYCDSVWPGKVSVIVPSVKAPTWIRRGNASVAYRQPDIDWLQQLIARTGPLIAPSANPEGEEPAMSIDEAVAYFGDMVDIYVDGGVVDDAHPSQIMRLNPDGTMERLR